MAILYFVWSVEMLKKEVGREIEGKISGEWAGRLYRSQSAYRRFVC
jgi:hypothetical protein